METSHKTTFVVADTSGLYSLISETDTNHAAALRATEQFHQQAATLLLPYDVYAETINIIGKKHGHDQAVAVAHYLTSPTFVMFDSSHEARRNALDRFAVLPQSVSYTDCVVMAVADEYHTKQIFGFDEQTSPRHPVKEWGGSVADTERNQ